MNDRLEIVPITQREANAFVKKHHRHHKPVVGSIFQIAVAKNESVVGVIIVGRPVARLFDNGWTVEVNRCCTNGEKNVCSMLYSAAWRVAKNLGYKRCITYILSTESGISLNASGWRCIGEAGGGTWDRKKRPRVDTMPNQMKVLYEIAE